MLCCWLQDVSHNCQGQYNLLPMAECADTASTPLSYVTCNGSCSADTEAHYVYEPWGSCSATCGGGTQSRTGTGPTACVLYTRWVYSYRLYRPVPQKPDALRSVSCSCCLCLPCSMSLALVSAWLPPDAVVLDTAEQQCCKHNPLTSSAG